MQVVYPKALTGTIEAIPAKAHAHRSLIAAALAAITTHATSTIHISHSSKDIDATMASLRALGVSIHYQDGIATISSLAPHTDVTEDSMLEKGQILPHESGTTLRLLLPVAAALCHTVEVDAKGRLPERPLEPLLGQLKAHGITISSPKPPFTMTGRLQGGTFSMVGDVSSQFFSGLLLAAPLIGGMTLQSTTPLQSRDYVTLTIATMKDFGVSVETIDHPNGTTTFIVPPGQSYQGQQDYHIEGDWSNGAIWIVASAMTGQSITITGLRPDSLQADKRILDILDQCNATYTWNQSSSDTPMSITIHGRATRPIHVNLEQMPDLLPVLSSLAASIPGESSFIRGARLRLKESDRLEAIAQLVRDSGGSVRLDGDDLYLTGTGHLIGGTVNCVNDHRLVMAGALNSLIASDPMVLQDSHAISKSYPHFFEDWARLGGATEEQ